MFLNHILLGFLGIAFGGAVAAGTFAFVIVIGVVPRMIGKCNRAAGTLCFEQAITLAESLEISSPYFCRCIFRLDRYQDISFSACTALGGNVCRLYRGGSRRDIKHIPNPVPPGKTESGTAVGHVDDGGRQDVRGVLLFCEENRGRGVVGTCRGRLGVSFPRQGLEFQEEFVRKRFTVCLTCERFRIRM